MDTTFGPLEAMRLSVMMDSPVWVILSEVRLPGARFKAAFVWSCKELINIWLILSGVSVTQSMNLSVAHLLDSKAGSSLVSNIQHRIQNPNQPVCCAV